MFKYRDSQGERLGDGSLFEKATGARWLQEMAVSSDEELQIPVKVTGEEYTLQRFLLPEYALYKRRPPSLLLCREEANGEHSLRAAEKIDRGRVIVEYLGEWDPHYKNRSSYRWGPIDGKRCRNLAAMAEDAFPSASALTLYHFDHIPIRVLFVALEEIDKEGMIALHYGMNHSVKLQYHSEYRSEEMKRFFRKNSLNKIVGRIDQLSGRSTRELGWKRFIELENLTVKLRYIYQTPTALLQLILEEVVDREYALSLWKNRGRRFSTLGFSPMASYREKEVAGFLQQIEEGIELMLPLRSDIIAVLGKWRERVFYRCFLKRLLQGAENPHVEPAIWDEALSDLANGRKEYLELRIMQSQERKSLLEECLLYAKEMQSPLLAWLEEFSSPLFPLPQAG